MRPRAWTGANGPGALHTRVCVPGRGTPGRLEAMTTHYLHKLFEPGSIAVFGASERADSVAGRIFRNLQEGGFPGRLLPVNPRYEQVFDVPARPSLEGVEDPIDLAIIATPPATVPAILQDCGAHGVGVAIVASAGFGEAGADGRRLERDMLRAARAHGIRLLGPNCLGLVRPRRHLNATFGAATATPGRIGLVSQSGALCTAILDWAAPRQIGFSAVVSLGAAADLDFGDLIDWLALDSDTHSILLYVEGVHQPRRFLSALRSAARIKPVIVIKAGRHESGSRAALSHTGALVGNDDAFNAALDRAGAVRVRTIGQLFGATQILADYPGEAGRRLAIVTNAGGPGVLAADRASDLGIELPSPDEAVRAELATALPASWSQANPLDILGDATPERYAAAVSACLDSPAFDGVLVILTPQAMTDPLSAAEVLIAARARTHRPILACWMGGDRVEPGRRRFYEARVPHFPSPEAAVEAFSYLARRRRNRELLLQVPGPRAHVADDVIERSRRMVRAALAAGRRVLTASESLTMLSDFGVPAGVPVPAASADAAVAAAESLGFPVALKIDSPDITHKSDVDGVRLKLSDAGAVRRAHDELLERVRTLRPDARITGVTLEPMYTGADGRELMIGVARDGVFGPVVSFGAGGTAVEILQDRALALPPLNEFIAERMIADTRVSAMLGDWRNLAAIDRPALVRALLAVSDLVCELPEVAELDINPLMASPGGVLALDARVVLEPPPATDMPYGHMAIHPFPAHQVEQFRTSTGLDVTIRPIRPEDAEAEQAFVRGLSATSRYHRFTASMRELTREALVRFTQIDYDREMALIAVAERDGDEVQLGVARYTTLPDGVGCEFAIVVADEVQGTGLGRRLLEALVATARNRGLEWMEGETLATNAAMRGLARRAGFRIRPHPDDLTLVRMYQRLQPGPPRNQPPG